MPARSHLSLLALVFAALTGCDGSPSTCPPGAAGCPCAPARHCDDGLECIENACGAAELRTVRIDAEGARACELLLVDRDETVRGIELDGIEGAQVREAPRTAIAIHAPDRALPATALRVRVVGEGAPPRVDQTRCFDAEGRLLASASARIER